MSHFGYEFTWYPHDLVACLGAWRAPRHPPAKTILSVVLAGAQVQVFNDPGQSFRQIIPRRARLPQMFLFVLLQVNQKKTLLLSAELASEPLARSRLLMLLPPGHAYYIVAVVAYMQL